MISILIANWYCWSQIHSHGHDVILGPYKDHYFNTFKLKTDNHNRFDSK